MNNKLLTIGMATYDDFDGVYFTIQALKMYHSICKSEQVEFIVVDNNPTSAHGKEVRNFVEGWVKGKYIPYTNKSSTSVRNEIFTNATGKYTMSLDCHVLVEPDGINELLRYYMLNPDSKDIVQGPLVYDDLRNYCTHFDPVWRGHMYGVWGSNREAMTRNLPFEIPMQGLGLFSCKTSNWQGFNPDFKGFGGEEGYIHEKFRRAGGKAICLPNLKWVHRFGRPNGVKYPLNLEDRIWNYFLGWLEIHRDVNHEFIQKIKEYFISEKVSVELIERLAKEAALKLGL